MQDHHENKDLPGYNRGCSEVAKSPISFDELQDLKASALFTDEDMVYLRLSYDVLKDQAENLVAMWRGIIARHTHLASYSWDRKTGKPDKAYGEAVGKRFAQWVLRHSAETVNRIQEAWWKSMILQVTLWSQPYMNPGDF